MFNTPILFLVFNRLDTTKQVFAKIREIQPRQLFIGADGARPEKEGEKEKVEAVRKYVLDNIDWDCEVKTLFREKNLGCGVAPAEAITWFFENVEQGIILEDDCLPDLSFFTFCEELLNYYKDEERVMHIAGTNFQDDILVGNASYFISKWPSGWGWASWASAWAKYDFKLDKITEQDLQDINQYYQFDKKEKVFWKQMFYLIKKEFRYDIWDLQWSLTIFKNKGYSIHPQKNLISNIGFGEDATHTIQIDNNLGNKKITRLDNIHFIDKNQIKITSSLADKRTFNYFAPSASFIDTVKGRVARILPTSLKKFLKYLLK
ncbi:MAG: nucleotide-diphospho-sugar transferase [Cytophagales bacterium]|nr:MAG: nucleotide-diphospho-sugar transferase [Cytophagales bacterium]